LEEAVARIDKDYPLDQEGNINEDNFLDDIIKEGLIQCFEYTQALAWKVMKDYLKDVGEVKAIGSKVATREARTADWIAEGEIWMEMISSRNQTSHTYNEDIGNDIFNKAIKEYFPEFMAFRDTMEHR
jgi:nucleotidyltransferase substrate binding protein (TIGR01987 family)